MKKTRDVIFKVKQKVEKFLLSDTFKITFFVSIALLTCILIGIKYSRYSDYSPINGDFQTYNMIRRFLDGQVPVRDYFVYLGFGPLYMGSLFMLFKNTFSFSLIIADAVSIIILALSLCLVYYIVTKKWKDSTLFSSIFIVIMYYCIFVFKGDFGYIIRNSIIMENIYLFFSKFSRVAKHGHSLKPWRSLIIIIVSFILILFIQNDKNKIRTFLRERNFYVMSALCGAFASFIIIWSNDYGISSYISISFCYFLWMVVNKRIKDIILGTFIYSLSTCLGVYLLISFITRGNFIDWMKFTLSVSNYQSWYYEFEKNLSLTGIIINLYVFVYMIVIIYNIVKILKCKNTQETAINYVLVFALSSNIIASYIYQIGSCVYTLLSYTYSMLDSFVVALVVSALVKLYKATPYKLINKYIKSYITYGIYVIFIVMIIQLSIYINTYIGAKTGIDLDGKMDNTTAKNGEALIELDNIIKDENYFSTYASAFETMRDEFQPTRFDYIIHVLGDDYRDEYINEFLNGDYKYVLTIDSEFNAWEGWVQNANWFFYRELYNQYTPEYNIGYNIVWEKNPSIKTIEDNLSINVNRINDNQSEIYIISNKQGNYIADVKLKYKTTVNDNGILSATHHSMIRVELDNKEKKIDDAHDYYNVYNIPNNAEHYYIPIYIRDGVGCACLTYIPTGYGILEIEEVKVENIFPNSIDDFNKNN